MEQLSGLSEVSAVSAILLPEIPDYCWARAKVESRFPPSPAEGWLTVGPVALGRRKIEAGGGTNSTERIDSAWLLGARTTLGALMLVVNPGNTRVTGRNRNSGPVEEQRAWTAGAELSCMLGHYISLGTATFRNGVTRARGSGTFVFLQVGWLP